MCIWLAYLWWDSWSNWKSRMKRPSFSYDPLDQTKEEKSYGNPRAINSTLLHHIITKLLKIRKIGNYSEWRENSLLISMIFECKVCSTFWTIFSFAYYQCSAFVSKYLLRIVLIINQQYTIVVSFMNIYYVTNSWTREL